MPKKISKNITKIFWAYAKKEIARHVFSAASGCEGRLFDTF